MSASTDPAPRRERVTGEPRHVHRAPHHRTQWEIEEQTTLGAAYVSALMRSQLRAGIAVFAALALPVLTLPLFFAALGDPVVVWLVLGFGCYPPFVALAWWYVRRAERNERDFARLVHGTDRNGAP
ncbi:hypothetical protein [Streptomyces sp. NPDC058045]|uniref:hypothetical protein n=1 Tax=Streptomyces sp. NPDC058045 TaxID=3346311 RepID=UPI0036E63142